MQSFGGELAGNEDPVCYTPRDKDIARAAVHDSGLLRQTGGWAGLLARSRVDNEEPIECVVDWLRANQVLRR